MFQTFNFPLSQNKRPVDYGTVFSTQHFIELGKMQLQGLDNLLNVGDLSF